MSHKEFRVFYGLIQTFNDMASPVHMKKKNLKAKSESEDCTASINSNKSLKEQDHSPKSKNGSKQSIAGETSQFLNAQKQREMSNSLLQEVKQWFETLSHDERVNALTTTSPYLSEILGHMYNI